ncbi:hypothetical protein LAZ67_4001042 [Cordylochernes scorpioides]|uniref:Tc1-like transposase DDE domain-containing protein n=1 Tax=Cordylochernes scorpioides TaxID=51811 RepID=A0ABY6KBV0_9ARAC|nr:hypothetical protein LAZ67_4001042 [Cordylochernes scorpioides]
MGSPLSTVVAEVVMRSLDQWITSRHSSDIFLWRRYIDDTFCLANCSNGSDRSLSHITNRSTIHSVCNTSSSVCAYHSTPFTAVMSVRKTSIASSTPRRQWCDKRRIWTAECNKIVFTDESRFCLQNHDGRIRVWRHLGERMLNSCVMHRHTGPAPGIMVWGGIGYHSRTPLVRFAGTLNSQRYIFEVLEPVVLPYLQDLPTVIFKQDNAQPHVAHIFKRFFVNHQIELLPCPARSPDLSPIENMWSMVAQRLTQNSSPAATSDQLFQRVEDAWSLYPKITSKVSLNQSRGMWKR